MRYKERFQVTVTENPPVLFESSEPSTLAHLTLLIPRAKYALSGAKEERNLSSLRSVDGTSIHHVLST